MRAYKKRSVGVLRFYMALATLLSLIVFFFGDRILVMPIWALMFLFYVLTITPPPDVDNKITKFGIVTGDNTYRFDFLSHFYFIKKFDYNVLVVVSHSPYFYHIYLVVKNKEMVPEIIKVLSKHLVYQENPRKTFTDKLTDILTSLMPDTLSSESPKEEKESDPSKEKLASL